MQIDVTGHGLDLTDALNQRIKNALEKIRKHDFSTIHRVHVVLEAGKNSFHCDMQAQAGSASYQAKSDAEDMYIAIDQTAGKLDRQVQASKGRDIGRRKDKSS